MLFMRDSVIAEKNTLERHKEFERTNLKYTRGQNKNS